MTGDLGTPAKGGSNTPTPQQQLDPQISLLCSTDCEVGDDIDYAIITLGRQEIAEFLQLISAVSLFPYMDGTFAHANFWQSRASYYAFKQFIRDFEPGGSLASCKDAVDNEEWVILPADYAIPEEFTSVADEMVTVAVSAVAFSAYSYVTGGTVRGRTREMRLSFLLELDKRLTASHISPVPQLSHERVINLD